MLVQAFNRNEFTSVLALRTPARILQKPVYEYNTRSTAKNLMRTVSRCMDHLSDDCFSRMSCGLVKDSRLQSASLSCYPDQLRLTNNI